MNGNICIETIRKAQELTPEAELNLSFAAYNGCEKSKQALILSLLQTLVKSLRAYRLDSELYQDCLSEGTITIIRAVNIFNPQRGYTLSSYVSWFIHSAIRNTLRKHNSLISIPKNLWYKAKSIEKSAASSDFSNKAPLPQTKLFSEMQLSGGEISASSGHEGPADSAERSYLSEIISEGLARLSSFERQIISAKYGFGLEKASSRKLAQKLGCTRSAVLKAEESARRSLRIFFTEKGLRSFIGGE